MVVAVKTLTSALVHAVESKLLRVVLDLSGETGGGAYGEEDWVELKWCANIRSSWNRRIPRWLLRSTQPHCVKIKGHRWFAPAASWSHDHARTPPPPLLKILLRSGPHVVSSLWLAGDDRLHYLRPDLDPPVSPLRVILASYWLRVKVGGARREVAFVNLPNHTLDHQKPVWKKLWHLPFIEQNVIFSIFSTSFDNKMTRRSISIHSEWLSCSRCGSSSLPVGPKQLTLNLLSSCAITWSVVIRLEMRTLVEAPKDGVNMDVCGGSGWGRSREVSGGPQEQQKDYKSEKRGLLKYYKSTN